MRANEPPVCGPWETFLADKLPRLHPAFPDKASVYYPFFLNATTGPFDALFVRGQFPSVCYLSLTIDDSSFYAEIDSISHYEMPAEPGSTNPCLAGTTNRSGVYSRNYSFFPAKEGVDFDLPSGYISFTIGADVTQTALMYRV